MPAGELYCGLHCLAWKEGHSCLLDCECTVLLFRHIAGRLVAFRIRFHFTKLVDACWTAGFCLWAIHRNFMRMILVWVRWYCIFVWSLFVLCWMCPTKSPWRDHTVALVEPGHIFSFGSPAYAGLSVLVGFCLKAWKAFPGFCFCFSCASLVTAVICMASTWIPLYIYIYWNIRRTNKQQSRRQWKNQESSRIVFVCKKIIVFGCTRNSGWLLVTFIFLHAKRLLEDSRFFLCLKTCDHYHFTRELSLCHLFNINAVVLQYYIPNLTDYIWSPPYVFVSI